MYTHNTRQVLLLNTERIMQALMELPIWVTVRKVVISEVFQYKPSNCLHIWSINMLKMNCYSYSKISIDLMLFICLLMWPNRSKMSTTIFLHFKFIFKAKVCIYMPDVCILVFLTYITAIGFHQVKILKSLSVQAGINFLKCFETSI